MPQSPLLRRCALSTSCHRPLRPAWLSLGRAGSVVTEPHNPGVAVWVLGPSVHGVLNVVPSCEEEAQVGVLARVFQVEQKHEQIILKITVLYIESPPDVGLWTLRS